MILIPVLESTEDHSIHELQRRGVSMAEGLFTVPVGIVKEHHDMEKIRKVIDFIG